MQACAVPPSCATLWGSSIHRILQARILEWVAIYMQLKKWAKTNLSFSDTLAEELMLLNCGVAKTLESPLDCKETQPVHPKGDQSWVFIGRTDAETETPILWRPDAKS